MTDPLSVDFFELICALEQTICDLCAFRNPMAGPADGLGNAVSVLREAAVSVARALWLEPGCGAAAIRALPQVAAVIPAPAEYAAYLGAVACGDSAAGVTEYSALGPVWPECLTSAPVDYPAFMSAAVTAAEQIGAGLTMVVGIRSGGSYLAPIWTAGLRHSGVSTRYVTVRPLGRHLAEAETTVAAGVETAAPDRPGCTVFVLDEGMGTGRSMSGTLRWAGQAFAPGRVTMVLSSGAGGGKDSAVTRFAGVGRLSPQAGRWPPTVLPGRDGRAIQDYLAAALLGLPGDDIAVESATELPPEYWLSYVSALTGIAPDLLVGGPDTAVRCRRYLLTGRRSGHQVRIVAKYIGYGVFSAAEMSRLLRRRHGPRTLGIGDGYLFYEWVDGTELGAGSAAGLTATDLAVLAGTTADVMLTSTLGWLVQPRSGQRVEETVLRLREYGPARVPDPAGLARAVAKTRTPILLAPPNQAHWHYLRTASGIVRLHQEAAQRWLRLDPAEDLASMAVELALSDAQLAALVRNFARLTGHEIPAPRLAAGLLSAIVRALDEYGWARSVAERLTRPARRTGEAVSRFEDRRDALLAAVPRASDILGLAGPSLAQVWQSPVD